jgi:hypothetical protein
LILGIVISREGENAMKEAAGFITSLFSGLDLRRRWVAGVLAAILLLASLWVFESYTGYFFYQTLERRVGLLERMRSLGDEGIHSDSQLYPIYQATVEQLANRIDFRVQWPSISPADPTSLGKAISGSSVWILILVVGVVSEIRKVKRISGTAIGVALTVGLIAYLFGWIGTILPTLGNPWVNYILFPVAQLLLLWLLARKGRK